MKKFLLFSALLMLWAILPAQKSSSLAGVYTGKAVKNGQPMGFTLKLRQNGRYEMAYDLNPNDLTVKGAWSLKKGILTFKNSDGILRLKRNPQGTSSHKGFMIFPSRNGKISFSKISGPISLMGWDEGVAAVVVNHEEQY